MITLITKYIDILAKEALLFHMKNDNDWILSVTLAIKVNLTCILLQHYICDKHVKFVNIIFYINKEYMIYYYFFSSLIC